MNTSPVRQAALMRAIEIVGSQSALARALGKKQPYVPKWLKSATGLPADYCPDVERLTDRQVRCEHLNDSVDWQYVRRGGMLDALDEIIQVLIADGFDQVRISACLANFAERERALMQAPRPTDQRSEE
jgi:DNA-binding transcriptional regulator YdaS (Cro superfamily)